MSSLQQRQQGSIYVPVLGASTIVAIVGLSAIWLTRMQARQTQIQDDYTEARLYAQAAVEVGLWRIASDPDWRTSQAGTPWADGSAIGRGTYSLTVTDPNDGDLSDSEGDSVILTGTGQVGAARHQIQVTLVAVNEPLEALLTCLHAGGELKVNSGRTFTVIDGPGSSNANLRIDGTLDGDAEGAHPQWRRDRHRDSDRPAPAKPMPDAGVFQRYKDLAVTVPQPGGNTLEKVVLSPALNPFGVTSPDGVYYIDTGGSDLTIKALRLWGTLVIKATGKKVVLDDAVFMKNYRCDYPVLIVDGDVEIKCRGREYGLLETNWATNFNPPGTPYQGVSDLDTSDAYPNQVQGLVHVKGSVLLQESSWICGTVIAEGSAVCDQYPTIMHDSSLHTDPPIGYRTTRMAVAEGSWRQAVGP